MYRNELKQHLFELTPMEKKRKELGEKARTDEVISPFYKFLQSKGLQDKRGIFRLPGVGYQIPRFNPDPSYWDALDYSPHQSALWLRRASRYLREPFMYADFITIRYVYSGADVIYTQSGSFTVKANDIVMFNSGFVFSQYLAHDEDIAFTFMLEKKYLLENVIKNLSGKSVLTQFILDYILNNRDSQNYIIFHGGQNDRFAGIIEDIVCEYMDPTPYGKLLITSYLNIFLAEMTCCRIECSQSPKKRARIQLVEILDYIDKNYMTVTLEQLAKEFNKSFPICRTIDFRQIG